MRKSDFTLPTLDDLFSTQAERDDAKLERVRNIPLAELHPFKGHPFKVQNNEEMQRMIESIRKVGAITPALARSLPDGGYELISGHRRLAACQVLGVETMPVIVRELSDDEAVIAMVDANLQRETILPSEKAFAYKMKLDALNHQGITSGQVGQKWSREKMADEALDSGRQIQRYIRLTYLIPELLSMVDDGKIAFNPAVELSYLDSYQQRAVLDAMALNDCTPSHAQSIRLKKLAQEGVLDDQMIYAVLAETKPNQQEQLKFKREELRKYFPSGYTEEQMRRDIINMTANAGSGHPGGSLSAVELVASVFYNHMRIDPQNPHWADRDRFVLSKGHAAPCYYAVLAELGFISRDEFKNFRQLHSILQGHPDCKKVPGVDASTGSLGQGCSIAVGMALGAKVQGKDTKVFTLLGDGECQEGQIWEALMSAAHYKLDNLTVIVDNNGLQIDGSNDEVMSLGDMPAKLRAFGFDLHEIDGHDLDAIEAALGAPVTPGRPKAILAHTVKGKGVSFMEGQVGWHGKAPNEEQRQQALKELED